MVKEEYKYYIHLSIKDEDSEHQVSSTSRDNCDEDVKTVLYCFDDRTLADFKKQKKDHKEIIVGLVVGVAMPK